MTNAISDDYLDRPVVNVLSKVWDQLHNLASMLDRGGAGASAKAVSAIIECMDTQFPDISLEKFRGQRRAKELFQAPCQDRSKQFWLACQTAFKSGMSVSEVKDFILSNAQSGCALKYLPNDLDCALWHQQQLHQLEEQGVAA